MLSIIKPKNKLNLYAKNIMQLGTVTLIRMVKNTSNVPPMISPLLDAGKILLKSFSNVEIKKPIVLIGCQRFSGSPKIISSKYANIKGSSKIKIPYCIVFPNDSIVKRNPLNIYLFVPPRRYHFATYIFSF